MLILLTVDRLSIDMFMLKSIGTVLSIYLYEYEYFKNIQMDSVFIQSNLFYLHPWFLCLKSPLPSQCEIKIFLQFLMIS